jgi:hypothetical protein
MQRVAGIVGLEHAPVLGEVEDRPAGRELNHQTNFGDRRRRTALVRCARGPVRFEHSFERLRQAAVEQHAPDDVTELPHGTTGSQVGEAERYEHHGTDPRHARGHLVALERLVKVVRDQPLPMRVPHRAERGRIGWRVAVNLDGTQRSSA